MLDLDVFLVVWKTNCRNAAKLLQPWTPENGIQFSVVIHCPDFKYVAIKIATIKCITVSVYICKDIVTVEWISGNSMTKITTAPIQRK